MFSDRERTIIKIIGNKKVTRSYLCDEVFTVEVKPFHAEQIVGNSVRSIINKCKFYNLPWTLVREKTGTGRQSISKVRV